MFKVPKFSEDRRERALQAAILTESSKSRLLNMRPKAEWAIDSEAMRARGIIVLVKFN